MNWRPVAASILLALALGGCVAPSASAAPARPIVVSQEPATVQAWRGNWVPRYTVDIQPVQLPTEPILIHQIVVFISANPFEYMGDKSYIVHWGITKNQPGMTSGNPIGGLYLDSLILLDELQVEALPGSGGAQNTYFRRSYTFQPPILHSGSLYSFFDHQRSPHFATLSGATWWLYYTKG